MAAALAVCLAIFVWQIWIYWFLTDDAFISFRYARNLRNGYGLVFNPGFERVEGYTNFLWVVILAGVDWLTGWAPHLTANWLSAAVGVALLTLPISFCWERGPIGSHRWLIVFLALWLAMNRSLAVWCTSGLETKLFELLVVGAVFLGIREVERRDSSGWRSAALFALAALTRPDGVLLAGVFFAGRFAYEAYGRRVDLRATAKAVLLFSAIVGAHTAFRWVYYGELLPNTYYAKLGGASWWDMGFLYLGTFLLEYGAVVWLPLLVIASVGLARERRPAAAWLIGITIFAHALYLAYCGGDHFEYRPADLYFPLLAVLLYDGLGFVSQRWGRRVAVAWGGACCAAIAILPLLSHLDFPSDYRTGFPGGTARADDNRDLIDLRRHPWLVALPGASLYLRTYNGGYKLLSRHFVALRQEEHRGFLSTVEPEGKLLGEMVADGLLPRDTFIAIPCVGAIPYFSDLRTLDSLGLTDKVIARQAMRPNAQRAMAHDKTASRTYMVESGVEISAAFLDPHLLLQATSPKVEYWSYIAHYAGAAGQMYKSKALPGGYHLIGVMLQPDPEARFPALELTPFWE